MDDNVRDEAAAVVLVVPGGHDDEQEDDDDDDENDEAGGFLPAPVIIDRNDDSEGTWLGLLNNDDLEFTNMLLHYPKVFLPSSFLPLTEDFQSWERSTTEPSAGQSPPSSPSSPEEQPQRRSSDHATPKVVLKSDSDTTSPDNDIDNNDNDNSSDTVRSSQDDSDITTTNSNNINYSMPRRQQHHDPYYLCLDWTDTSMNSAAFRTELLQKFRNRQEINRLVVALSTFPEHQRRPLDDDNHVMDVLADISEPDRIWKSISFLGGVVHSGDAVARHVARNSHHISGLAIHALRNVGTLNFVFMFLDYNAISQRLLRPLPSLHTLRFKRCPVFMEESLDLVRTMETHGSVTSLCFSDCSFIGRRSMSEFLQVLSIRLSSVRNLMTLQLNSCDMAEAELCQILERLQLHPTLACLDVGGNPCQTNASIEVVTSMISHQGSQLIDLNISSLWGARGRILNLNFQPLFQALAANDKLRRLDFSSNTVRHDDMPHLAHALRTNTKLLSIDLRHMMNDPLTQHLPHLSDAMEEELFQSLANNHRLQCLRISVNEPPPPSPPPFAAVPHEYHVMNGGGGRENRDSDSDSDSFSSNDEFGLDDPNNNHQRPQQRQRYPKDPRFVSFSRLEFYPYLNWAGRHLLSALSLDEVPLALWPHVWQRVLHGTNGRFHKPQCVYSAIFHMLRCPDGDMASLPLAVSIAMRSNSSSLSQGGGQPPAPPPPMQVVEQQQEETLQLPRREEQDVIAASIASVPPQHASISTTTENDQCQTVGTTATTEIDTVSDRDCKSSPPQEDMEPKAKRIKDDTFVIQ